jgi:hypothetical protein
VKLLKNEMKNGEEKNRWKTEKKKKWTEVAVGGTYMPVLPTTSPMDIKLIIILIYFVGEVLKIHR